MYYWSNNKQGNSINIKSIVTALDIDFEPYYYIKFLLTTGVKIDWEYISKEMRDKEFKEIRELRVKNKIS